MSTIDVESFKTRLLEERERTRKAIAYLHEENRGTTEDEAARALRRARQPPGGHRHGHVRPRARLDARGERGAAPRRTSTRRSKRIEDGTYGTCENCGQAIDVERLEAMPWATLCIDCKRKAERG